MKQSLLVSTFEPSSVSAPLEAPSAPRPILWFSCGAASFCAASLALRDFPAAEIIYIDPGWEHEDNFRFLRDAAEHLGRPIKILRSGEYENPAEVFLKRRFIKSPYGAPCTEVLKKGVRFAYETALEIQVFGFHQGEQHRADRLRASNAEQAHLFRFPLIERGWTKKDCLLYVERLGIELPAMYRLGFKNANCIGCVKGGKGYWKKIRRLFPDRFEEMATLEAALGYSLFDVPLRDIDWGRVKEEGGLVGECGVLCNLPLFPPSL